MSFDELKELERASHLHRAGRGAEAGNLCRQIIKRNPANVQAVHFLGVIEAGAGNLKQAEQLMARSIALQPTNLDFVEHYSTILYQLGNYQSAIEVSEKGLKISAGNTRLLFVRATSLAKLRRFDEALIQLDGLLEREPNNVIAIHEQGSIFYELKQFDAALAKFDRALALDHNSVFAHLNVGNIYGVMQRHEDAFRAFDRALSLKPDLAIAWLGRGNVSFDMKNYDQALHEYDRALAIAPGLASAWLGRGNIFFQLSRVDEANAAYDAALGLMPNLEGAWLGRANICAHMRRYTEAMAYYDKALELNPHLIKAWFGRSNAAFQLKRYQEAIFSTDKVLMADPRHADAWYCRGNALLHLKRCNEAVDNFEKAIEIRPDWSAVKAMRVYSKLQNCDWKDYYHDCAEVIASISNGNVEVPPFVFISLPSTSKDQLLYAKHWIASKRPASTDRLWNGEQYNHDRIRVGYLSADFHQHATSTLMAGLFECHDKSRFEITALSCGPDDGSTMRQRLIRSFEHFIDCRSRNDDEVANLVRSLEVDILVDLKGFTEDSRTGIFARRPSPIQVNYLGYPGSMGADYIDYIIADNILIPVDRRDSYSEKTVIMPNSYQVNDSKRPISERRFTRSELGLPLEGFVFCSFNSSYKIAPRMFDCWMNILKEVDDSVLWLLEDDPRAADNLRNEAIARDVNPARVIFGKRIALDEHLARLRCADLFLDTLPCNAHTTASDALWAGLPVLTCPGDSFASRVGASLVCAAGLPELVVHSLEDYTSLAIELAKNAKKLVATKTKLTDHRLTAPLFNTVLFAKQIEEAYVVMYERSKAGLAPEHIFISN